MLRTVLLVLGIFTLPSLAIKESQSHWRKLGVDELMSSLNVRINENRAKNVLLFVGDGLGLTTTTAARIYGRTETSEFSFEKFQHIGLLKTYSADKLVSDSCSSGTALFTGVKINQKTVGVDASVERDDCGASLKEYAQLGSVVKWAQEAGKATGFVTTTRITHATPASLYAHSANRNWECRETMPETAKACKDIARQLIEDLPGRDINVIMGGGRQCLQSNVSGSAKDPIDTWSCYSQDGRDLLRDWSLDKERRGVKHQIVTNNEELANSDDNNEFILGVFANGHLKMDYERDRGAKGTPSLANMTEKAIKTLQKNDNGFLLMVEGGLIDYGHHRGHARQALDETVRFAEAIDVGLSLVDEEETLIIVTADHAHSLIMTGYPNRGSNLVDTTLKSKMVNAYYTPLLYGTGGQNNYKYTGNDRGEILWDNATFEEAGKFNYSQQSAVLEDEVTHSGTDVVVYAKGPMAHLFTSLHEQTYVAYVVSYAAKIGPLKNFSNSQPSLQTQSLWLNLILLLFLKKIFE